VAVNRDTLGLRGEALFQAIILRPHPTRGFLFRPQFLGDKWPIADFIVELEGTPGTRPFFLAQVRTTQEGYTVRERRLRVACSTKAIQGLVSYPVPTYLVGIDEAQEVGYIISVNGEELSSLASMSTAYPLDIANMVRLWDEVNNYWLGGAQPKLTSLFLDKKWR
jgi:hypothetical protein